MKEENKKKLKKARFFCGFVATVLFIGGILAFIFPPPGPRATLVVYGCSFYLVARIISEVLKTEQD